MTDANTTDAAGSERPRTTAEKLPVEDAVDIANRIVDNVEEVIVGHHDSIEHLLTAVLADGHVLIEDVPGVGKTMLARAVARSVDCTFTRVQFTPDLLPSDVTGVNVFNQKTREFEFQPGPLFGNIVLGDEINRAPPKTQSALLEAMEENQVTVDGETHDVPDPFVVVATQNTVEPNRTYELPMAELDRFMKKLTLGYPDENEESELLASVAGDHPIDGLAPVASTEELSKAQATAATIAVTDPIREYATRLTRFTRDHAQLGVSPRGTIALLGAAQARALLEGREYVIPDDVQTEASAVLGHRIQVEGASTDEGRTVVQRALETVAVE
ncbi:MAG: MoxR family ATPase [Halobacteriales archaeon]